MHGKQYRSRLQCACDVVGAYSFVTVNFGGYFRRTHRKSITGTNPNPRANLGFYNEAHRCRCRTLSNRTLGRLGDHAVHALSLLLLSNYDLLIP